jgi:GNAT superfamily N-acetyltransferase
MRLIRLLSNHPGMIPELAEAFEREWPDHYAAQPAGEAARNLATDTWLVAIEEASPVGVIALRPRVLPEIEPLTPALGGLLTNPAHRRRGVGSALIEAATALARSQGHKRLYTSTETAAGLVERLGWRMIDKVEHDGKAIRIFAVDL